MEKYDIDDEFAPSYMRRAIELARRGTGSVNPNPLVGAVIVKDGRIIGEGYHVRYGELHAERAAFASLKDQADAEGAVMYVTLEPCCHFGKQPPCVDAIIEHKIRKVYCGSDDPNAMVAGKGFKRLRDAGIEVYTHCLKAECDAINGIFFKYIVNKQPYVTMKYAMTMDGRIASRTGASKWITGETARAKVQKDRNRYMAIMAGIGTVLTDDPLLTCRIPGGRSPVRIICDSRLRLPIDCRIADTAKDFRTIIAACSYDRHKAETLREKGCEIMDMPEKDGHVDLKALCRRLGELGINGVFLEGGSSLSWSALEAGIVNAVQAYISPMIMGGTAAISPVGGTGADSPGNAFRLSPPRITVLGDDILLESEVIRCSQE